MDAVTVLDDFVPQEGRVVFTEFHLLAPRAKDTRHNPRDHLLWWMTHFVKRRAVLFELSTETLVNTGDLAQVPALLKMLVEGIEVVTSSARGRAILRARRNGAQSPGRPRKSRTKNREAAEALWRNPDIEGVKLKAALKKIGWTDQRARQEFGPRYGGEN